MTAKPKPEPFQPLPLVGVGGSTHCRICNRALKDPKSVILGIGPTCRGRAGGRAGKDVERAPGCDTFSLTTMDITMRRTPKGLGILNIPQTFKHHSPSGMEWGYAGSGASDLALNILARFLPIAQAPKKGNGSVKTVELWDKSRVAGSVWDNYQYFKAEYIVPMNYAGGTIEGREIVAWLMGQGVTEAEIALPGNMRPEIAA